jgi:hypothetical protein
VLLEVLLMATNKYKYDYQSNRMLNNDHSVDTMLYLKYQQHGQMIDLNEDAMFPGNHQMMMMIELVL